MLLTMLETRRGTEDGYTIRLYMRGETYNLGDTLAHSFLAAGFAIPALAEVKEPKSKEPKSKEPKRPAKKRAQKKRKTATKVKPKLVVKKKRSTEAKH